MHASPAEIGFSIAGVDVLLRGSPGAIPLGGFYAACPLQGRDLGVVIDFRFDSEMTRDREPWPGHPAFSQRLACGDAVELRRFDAEGLVRLPGTRGEPLRARFRAAPKVHAVEAAVRACASMALPPRGALILHASAVEAGGGAHIFAGVSGAGKSTLAHMLESGLPGCRRLSDELTVAAAQGGRWMLHVPPFIGGEGLPHGAESPIATLQFLEKAPIHERRALGAAAATQQLLRHILAYASHPETAGQILDLACALTGEVPCSVLAFRRDLGVANVIGIT